MTIKGELMVRFIRTGFMMEMINSDSFTDLVIWIKIHQIVISIVKAVHFIKTNYY